MIAEFFLTPDAFCESDEGIRQLKTCLFPFGNPPVGVICHFGEEEWETIVSRRIVKIPNANQRTLAMKLFQRVCSEVAVFRPPIVETPNDEDGWITQAQRSSTDLALDGIVASQNVEPLPGDCTRLSDFTSSAHWENFGNPRLVGRDVASQVPILNSICAHSDWLIIRMPQVKGGIDDEIVTIKQIIQLANRLPAGYKKSDIFVDVPLLKNYEEKFGTQAGAERLMRQVKSELAAEKVVGAELSVSIYPVKSFVNREVVAGEFAKESDGNISFKARWYLTMNHVAVGGKQAAQRDDSNSWNLYARSEASDRLDELGESEALIGPELV
jgi:hypothetical protein